MVIDGVVRNLEVIGEAVKKIPQNVKIKSPKIEWKKIAGLRDILIHEYFGIDVEIVWDIVKNKIPKLKEEVSKIFRAFNVKIRTPGNCFSPRRIREPIKL